MLANAVNVILRSRFYTEGSDVGAFCWSMLAAGVTLLLLETAQGGREVLNQCAALLAVGALIVTACYVAFTRMLAVQPLVPCLVAYGCAGILTLLRRSGAVKNRRCFFREETISR